MLKQLCCSQNIRFDAEGVAHHSLHLKSERVAELLEKHPKLHGSYENGGKTQTESDSKREAAIVIDWYGGLFRVKSIT